MLGHVAELYTVIGEHRVDLIGDCLDQSFQARARERQLARHSLGLAQNLGGSGATAVVTVLGVA